MHQKLAEFPYCLGSSTLKTPGALLGIPHCTTEILATLQAAAVSLQEVYRQGALPVTHPGPQQHSLPAPSALSCAALSMHLFEHLADLHQA